MNESSSLVAYVLALSAKAMAHLHLGQFGQALEIVRTARAQAEKNGSNPWMFMLREHGYVPLHSILTEPGS
jgi:hypothetical protein